MYETNPEIIAALSAEGWDTLIRETWNAPLPRAVLRIIEPEPRRVIIARMLERGMSRAEIASDLNLSLSMISLILSGKRN